LQGNFIEALGGTYSTFRYIELEDFKAQLEAPAGIKHRPVYKPDLR
jgi:hypothetical protein